jgi:hypothetical protein
LIEREKARVAKDYRVADDIRSELQREGIRIDDLNRTWSSADGRHGPRPSAYDDPSFRRPEPGFGGGGHGADPDRHRDRSRSRSRGRRRRDRSASSAKSGKDDEKED